MAQRHTDSIDGRSAVRRHRGRQYRDIPAEWVKRGTVAPEADGGQVTLFAVAVAHDDRIHGRTVRGTYEDTPHGVVSVLHARTDPDMAATVCYRAVTHPDGDGVLPEPIVDDGIEAFPLTIAVDENAEFELPVTRADVDVLDRLYDHG